VRLQKEKIIIWLTAITGIVLVSILIGYIRFRKTDTVRKNEELTLIVTPTAYVSPVPTLEPSTDINVLLLGYGGEGHDGGSLTDSITLADINPKRSVVTLISIPRDLWVNNNKVNEAYTQINGAQAAKKAVSEVTNLQVKYYASVDFGGFTGIIDILGGISVNVAHTFDDYFYPVKGKESGTCGKSPEDLKAINATMSGFLLEKEFTCRYEHIHFDKGIQNMNGETTLKFVRSRHSEQFGTDFARSERQRAVLIGLKDKLISLGVVQKIDPLFQKLKSSFKTDIDLDAVKSFLSSHPDVSKFEVRHIYLNENNVLKSSVGPQDQYILVPKAGDNNWSEVQKYIKDNLK